MNEPTKTTVRTDATNRESELSDDALENVTGGAAYIKFDGVDGESRKGNVEYSWKVERGD